MPNGAPGLGCMPGRSTGASRRVMPNHPMAAGQPDSTADSPVCLPFHPDLPANFNHCERKFDLVTIFVAIHGRMAPVTVANPSLRIALVARRHIDLKRVCSCCCLP
ncbi:Ms4527A family Cys-rich leader peptide [Mycobacterium sp. 1164966.3]|uniref:Ms4527A family Cys-rich leader peptide n=1 Tax=Mycobacterium sp. 1164966.3 TaxID=1856861 RepID=UPI00352E06D4